ncbi:hypothetical protein SLS56_004093 [Neofusicoccum ribis]|uniref:PAS domain-containing protein n=2 Tax=Neofusicoccum TaxID=407951 RepID=A0ABR3SXI6_9PEZI
MHTVKVAMRKNPRIQLGPIDLSCAITVCAGDLPDDPIIYCSEGFEALTQYRSDEVLGRNCRFLQVPHDDNDPTFQRRDSAHDAEAKARLKSDVAARQETQVEIINYKKSGEPFVNILSIIPVAWESEQVKYLVGFMARAS